MYADAAEADADGDAGPDDHDMDEDCLRSALRRRRLSGVSAGITTLS